MKYTLLYTKQSRKDIGKLDAVVKKHIKNGLEKFQKQPFSYAKKLTSSKIGDYRFRVGNHRIIADIQKDTIIILRIGHRRNIYER